MNSWGEAEYSSMKKAGTQMVAESQRIDLVSSFALDLIVIILNEWQTDWSSVGETNVSTYFSLFWWEEKKKDQPAQFEYDL